MMDIYLRKEYNIEFGFLQAPVLKGNMTTLLIFVRDNVLPRVRKSWQPELLH